MSAGIVPDWLREVLLAERFGWDYDQIQDAPDWWLQRALLWLDVRAAVAAKKSEG